MPWFGYRNKDGLAHSTDNATFYSGAAQTGSISHFSCAITCSTSDVRMFGFID